VSFHVAPEHYPIVGGILLETLETVLGTDTFNEDVKAAVADAYFFLADVFIAKESEIKKEKEEAEGGWLGWRTVKLEDKKAESSLHTSFMFSSTDDTPLYKYEPGQYISIKLDIPGQEYSQVRNYSLSDIPSSEVYRITVKKEADGAVSTYLHDTLEVGGTVEIGVPCGEFTLRMEEAEDVTFLAAGTGITPILSMMKSNVENLSKSTLIYRASDAESHPFKEEITQLADEGGLKVHWLYSNEMKENGIEFTTETIKNLIGDVNGKFFIVGPEGFLQDSQKYLRQAGVGSENIFFCFFGPPK